jgi:hypothetical protein
VSDYRDLVIEELADSEAWLIDRVVDLTIEAGVGARDARQAPDLDLALVRRRRATSETSDVRLLEDLPPSSGSDMSQGAFPASHEWRSALVAGDLGRTGAPRSSLRPFWGERIDREQSDRVLMTAHVLLLHLFDVQIERFKIDGLQALAETAANDWNDIWAGAAAGSGPSIAAEREPSRDV